MAALATEGGASPSGTALKETISSAVADRLATKFPTEAGIDEPTPRDSTAPVATFKQAESISAVPRIGIMAPHREDKPIYLPRFMARQEGPHTMALPHSTLRQAPRGTENRLGRLATEK